MARGTQKVCRREAVTIAAGTLAASALCAVQWGARGLMPAQTTRCHGTAKPMFCRDWRWNRRIHGTARPDLRS